MTVTRAPGFRAVPATGACEITEPPGTALEGAVLNLTVSPARCSVRRACSTVIPATSGITTPGRTEAPDAARCPGPGSWPGLTAR
nr:hypothetical protein [Spongiactinospora gelatinilytica]